MELDATCVQLRSAAAALAVLTAEQKNRALSGVKDALAAARADILAANARDVQKARSSGMKESLVARLALSESGIDDILASLDILIAQTDPIGQVVAGWKVPNGMEIRQVRVPLGVVAVIYESRPNVTVDAFALAYKSANAVLLRGSSSALESNRAILAAIHSGLATSGGISFAVALSESETHDDVDWILTAVGKIDVALPRGGAGLIKRVVQTARIPVIETGSGVCHIYVDETADADMAVAIAVNAKIQKPGACNALECLLVHRRRIADILVPLRAAFEKYADKTGRPGGVELRCDEAAKQVLDEENRLGAQSPITATDEDWGFEFLDYILAVRVVDSIDDAISHINRYNTKHSDAIITNDRGNARRFQNEVDAACVYVNASIRFTDGGQFGMGAELGISTQKLHARGPMGLSALTTTQFRIDGEGQIRP